MIRTLFILWAGVTSFFPVGEALAKNCRDAERAGHVWMLVTGHVAQAAVQFDPPFCHMPSVIVSAEGPRDGSINSRPPAVAMIDVSALQYFSVIVCEVGVEPHGGCAVRDPGHIMVHWIATCQSRFCNPELKSVRRSSFKRR